MSMPDLFREAVHEAHNGNREKSRLLLRELLQGEPRHELAWLWLSKVSDTLNEKIEALENAFAINPNREETAVSLNNLRKQELAQQDPNLDKMYQQAIAAYKEGRALYARNLLQHIVQKNKNHTKAWLGLGQIEPNMEDRIFALTVGLSQKPDHEKAKRHLQKLEADTTVDYFALAQRFEDFGLIETAVSYYQKAEQQTTLPSIQRIAKEKQMSLQAEVEKVIKFTSPTVHLIRLTSGPVFIYLLLIFTMSGINPLKISIPYLLSSLMVAFGSFLVVGANNVPHHPLWKNVFGEKGINSPIQRALLTGVGIFFLLMPFAILFVFNFTDLLVYHELNSNTLSP